MRRLIASVTLTLCGSVLSAAFAIAVVKAGPDDNYPAVPFIAALFCFVVAHLQGDWDD